MRTDTLVLKKMPSVAGRVHYISTHNDHLYIEEAAIKKEMPDEFEIPFSKWNEYFNIISAKERTEQDFEDDKETDTYFAEKHAKDKEIEDKLRKHGEECPRLRKLMEYAYKAFPHTDGNGFVNLKPLIRDFETCPYCSNAFD